MMIRSDSNFSRLNQDQHAVINSTSNATVKSKPSDTPEKETEAKISQKASDLRKGYLEKQRELDQTHTHENQKLQREYRQEKQSLEREYNQKKRALGISIYV